MILSNFIRQVNHWVLQNYGTLMIDDNDAIFQTSNMLQYIYSYRVWKWALVREEKVVVDETNLFTIDYNAVAIFRVEDEDWNEYKPAPMPFGTAEYENQNKYFNNWRTITISWTKNKIVVYYIKLPPRLAMADVNAEIDLPDEYINILYLLVMRTLYPYNLENWASLANNFKWMADDVLKVFEKTHSLWIAPTSVQFADIFKWR